MDITKKCPTHVRHCLESFGIEYMLHIIQTCKVNEKVICVQEIYEKCLYLKNIL